MTRSWSSSRVRGSRLVKAASIQGGEGEVCPGGGRPGGVGGEEGGLDGDGEVATARVVREVVVELFEGDAELVAAETDLAGAGPGIEVPGAVVGRKVRGGDGEQGGSMLEDGADLGGGGVDGDAIGDSRLGERAGELLVGGLEVVGEDGADDDFGDDATVGKGGSTEPGAHLRQPEHER
jgi:hypothetical protein